MFVWETSDFASKGEKNKNSEKKFSVVPESIVIL